MPVCPKGAHDLEVPVKDLDPAVIAAKDQRTRAGAGADGMRGKAVVPDLNLLTR